jgi:hypothetical protein
MDRDTEILLDLSDLTGDSDPVSLSDFINANSEPGVAPLDDRDVDHLRRLRPGQRIYLSIGGGAVEVRRVDRAAWRATSRKRMACRVAARFQRADQPAGARKDVRDLVKPINTPKGMSRETLKDYITTDERPDSVTPDRRDVLPKDVFQPKVKNMNVLDLARKGWPGENDDYKDMDRALRVQIPKDKGYDTVSNLSQYLVETGGGGGTKAVGRK